MYNKYLQTTCPPPDAPPPPPPCPPSKQQESSSIFSSLGNLFGKEGGLSRLFEQDTLLVVLILYFLLKDEDGIDHDLLLLAGIFLLIGL